MMNNEELKKMFSGNKEEVVKPMLTTEQIDKAYALINAMGDLVDVCANEELERLLKVEKDDHSMFQYVFFHQMVHEAMNTIGAMKDLLKMSKSDIDEVAKSQNMSVSEMTVKAMIAEIVDKLSV